MRYSPSIRQKVVFGYFLATAFIIGFSVFTFVELGYMQEKILFGENMSDFFSLTLEMRRYEKNYFLYGQDVHRTQNLRYAERSRSMLNNDLEGLRRIASAKKIEVLKQRMGDYYNLMNGYHREPGSHAKEPTLEARIRKTGEEITTIVEELSRNERAHLHRVLNDSVRLLAFSILVVTFSGIIIGSVLSRMVVVSLGQLEDRMRAIAEGRLENIRTGARDREIVSLIGAFDRMFEELDSKRKQLIQSEKLASLGTLLSGVAHELNNPISNISTSAEILAEELEGENQAFRSELLGQIQEQTDRARRIVRSLLEFSRDREFLQERLHLKTLLQETLGFMKAHVPASVTILIQVSEDTVIFADRQKLQQALLNLLENAVQSIEGGGSVGVVARIQSRSDGQGPQAVYQYASGRFDRHERALEIEITDTGAGIPPELLPRIFDPFFTTKDVGKGSGLGLSIVNEIIEMHNGFIGVRSEPGVGTTFLIRLPVEERFHE